MLAPSSTGAAIVVENRQCRIHGPSRCMLVRTRSALPGCDFTRKAPQADTRRKNGRRLAGEPPPSRTPEVQAEAPTAVNGTSSGRFSNLLSDHRTSVRRNVACKTRSGSGTTSLVHRRHQSGVCTKFLCPKSPRPPSSFLIDCLVSDFDLRSSKFQRATRRRP